MTGVDLARLLAQARVERALASPRRQRLGRFRASEVGVCQRKTAFAITGRPSTNPPTLRSLELMDRGTSAHEDVEALGVALEEAGLTGYTPEVQAKHPELDLYAQVDGLFWEDYDAGVLALVELKTEAQHAFRRRTRPRREALWQAHLGAAAHGASVIYVVYMPRDVTGDVDEDGDLDELYKVYRQPFDPAVHAEAVEWFRDVDAWLEQDKLPPIVRQGPGLDPICSSCEWRDDCWPPIPGRAPQAALVTTERNAARAARAYERARDREAKAKREKDFARAQLDALRPLDDDGGEVVVQSRAGRWRLRFTTQRGRLDTKAVEADYAESGVPLPRKPETTRFSLDRLEEDTP